MLPNQVQLITYPDSLGGNLAQLADLLAGPLAGLFPGGVHLLPPFPSSGDRGFAPRTYFEIDPQFGSWGDVQRIAEHHPVLLDLMVNHISRQSPYFQDFVRQGRASPWADLFLPLDKIWLGGAPPPAEVAAIFLRRPLTPFVEVPVAETGEVERVWATFGTRDWSEQIDLDVNSPLTRRLLSDILAHFNRQGVRIVRLDAIAFVIKKPGTSCFFVEPEIYAFLEWIRAEAGRLGITLLPEVHADYAIQRKLAGHGYWVYNFVLPLLILHSLTSRTAVELCSHLRDCPRQQFTMLDAHDGIPVQPDLNGLLAIEAAQAVVDLCLERGANLSQIHSVEHRLRPDFTAHQVNIAYYSALNGNDHAYLAARALQFFAPGIPQVYYMGLLAGENSPADIELQGEKRAINRHNYTQPEIEQALARPVVLRLFELIRFRNRFPAFQGEFEVLESSLQEVRLGWRSAGAWCRLSVDLETCRTVIDYQEGDQPAQVYIP